jgi:hypothetical protein
MSLDHEFMKLEPKEKRLAGTVNVSDADLKDHRQDHQMLLMLNRPILEAMELVFVQVQRTHLKECQQPKVDFHPHFHHLKNNLE